MKKLILALSLTSTASALAGGILESPSRLNRTTRFNSRRAMGITPSVPQRGHNVDASTLALWRFNESGQVAAVDASGHLNLSALGGSGGPTATTGVVDGGRLLSGNIFNGFGGETTPTAWQNIFRTGTYTFEGWIKPDSGFAANGYLWNTFTTTADDETEAKNYLSICHLDSTTRKLNYRHEYLAGNDFTAVSTGTVTLGVWTHVAVVRTTNGVQFYLNGVDAGFVAIPGGQEPTGGTQPQSFRLGVSPSGTAYFNGAFDDFRLSSVARSASEVLADYNAK